MGQQAEQALVKHKRLFGASAHQIDEEAIDRFCSTMKNIWHMKSVDILSEEEVVATILNGI